MHTVILVPGLGDDKPLSNPLLRFATAHWKNDKLNVVIHSVLWRNGEALDAKLQKILAHIDSIPHNHLLSLVGTSAGASLAFIAASLRSNRIHRVVNVCGRLRAGNHTYRSLKRMAQSSSAFYEAVTQFEQLEHNLPSAQRKRMLTITPFFGDEIVPADTVFLQGAHNQWFYSTEHMVSIFLALRSSMIPDFLQREVLSIGYDRIHSL